MISVDGSLFIQIINFLLMIFILNILVYKPVRKIIRQRRERVEGLENGIESLTGEAEEKKGALSSGIKAARVKGVKEKESLLVAAAQEEKSIIEKINIKAREELEYSRKKITDEVQKVRAALVNEIDVFANQISEKILGRAV